MFDKSNVKGVHLCQDQPKRSSCSTIIFFPIQRPHVDQTMLGPLLFQIVLNVKCHYSLKTTLLFWIMTIIIHHVHCVLSWSYFPAFSPCINSQWDVVPHHYSAMLISATITSVWVAGQSSIVTMATGLVMAVRQGRWGVKETWSGRTFLAACVSYS